uniref:Uncharacterized protein n=1 Tax=Arundo donax TaxID=35708 RepID=A0A0A8Y9F3_ARUDO
MPLGFVLREGSTEPFREILTRPASTDVLLYNDCTVQQVIPATHLCIHTVFDFRLKITLFITF